MRIEIQSLGQGIVCDMPQDICDMVSDHYFLLEYIPNARVIKSKAQAELNVHIGNTFDWQDKHITITKVDSDIRSFIVIVGALLEHKRQLCRLYQVHGSAVAIKGNAVAIIGGMSGIGKTSLALFMHTMPHVIFIGDEKFVLDGQNKTLVGGCPISKDNYKSKNIQSVSVAPYNGAVHLNLVVFPIITDEPSITYYKIDSLKLFWHLYEEASRDIRNLNMLYDNFTKTANSFDSDNIMKQRLIDIQNISTSTPAYFIRGNVSEVAKFIYNLITSST